MNYKKFSGAARAALMIVIMLMSVPGALAASKYKTLHTFTNGKDGGYPYAGLIRDGAGNLYGTTSEDADGYGVVFKLTPNANSKVKCCTISRAVTGAIPWQA